MTLEEAIWREEALAHSFKKMTKSIETQEQLAEEHKQMAEWLKELKDYKDARVGCEYCKHNYREQHERPCSLCQRNFMDMFEREVNADDN